MASGLFFSARNASSGIISFTSDIGFQCATPAPFRREVPAQLPAFTAEPDDAGTFPPLSFQANAVLPRPYAARPADSGSGTRKGVEVQVFSTAQVLGSYAGPVGTPVAGPAAGTRWVQPVRTTINAARP